MDWYNNRSKRSSISTGAPSYSPASYGILSTSLHSPFSHNQSRFTSGTTPVPKTPPLSSTSSPSLMTTTTPLERNSYYFSQLPLYTSDWQYVANSESDCIALGSYKEGFTNKLEIIHGVSYEQEFKNNDDVMSPTAGYDDDVVQGFYFSRVAETSVDYPITHLQWDPMMASNGGSERLAASSEVLRLYKVNKEEGYDSNNNHHNNYSLTQTHILANNTASSCTSSSNSLGNNGSSSKNDDINTYPPITSFDWNKTDPSILITSSVDTTCTVWDLHRSHPRDETTDTATVKTQLIAHDSEVFDVKCIHKSTNVFASVGNDGSMRVFDLRSLEHSTIIYEPPTMTATSSSSSSNPASSTFNSKALICLSTSNIDQHHLATVGINSNLVIIIDMRMPGIPVATLDGSFGGINHASINSIQWHPTSNYLLTGGDDCQALVWDCNNLTPKSGSSSSSTGVVLDTPVLAYEEDLEVNNVCWRKDKGDWMGVISGKGFQAVSI
ncbi:uncharacterized protein SPAPADRAFT_142494 [Spathaspora passalidarum NRRL Y-27907]|uniref:WD40 repeat-like protein n=1 Tax=Spathaspora passalidarum (strain NRRL Y-27907 / 11-Y1) TaxID=619300 RepID=G3ATF5_SPAPN|nr:uncharacterized protein SPAPADRAFT_142494 [Spathaspora passalidarum NRRL Y-27907]EGW30918.1 hypothetical protein SPAPADRAFT_142494 [Spathaspora passalidarum NRRL Y-27907]